MPFSIDKHEPYFTIVDKNKYDDESDRFTGKVGLKHLNEVFKCGTGMALGEFPVCEADTHAEKFQPYMEELKAKYIKKSSERLSVADKQIAIQRDIMDKMTSYVKNALNLFAKDYDKIPKTFGEYLDNKEKSSFKNCSFSKMMRELNELEEAKSSGIKSGKVPSGSDLVMDKKGSKSEVTLVEREAILDKYANAGGIRH